MTPAAAAAEAVLAAVRVPLPEALRALGAPRPPLPVPLSAAQHRLIVVRLAERARRAEDVGVVLRLVVREQRQRRVAAAAPRVAPLPPPA